MEQLNKKSKSDLFLSFICWLVFGPPMATILSTELSATLPTLILDQIYSFAIPALLFFYIFLFFWILQILNKIF